MLLYEIRGELYVDINCILWFYFCFLFGIDVYFFYVGIDVYFFYVVLISFKIEIKKY